MQRLLKCGALALVWLGLSQGVASAQGMVIRADSIAAARALSDAAGTVDRLISGVNVPGGKFALATLRRARPESNGLLHSNVTEVYLITRGSGNLVTGGTLGEPQPNELSRVWAGPGLTGTHQGGEAQRVGPGDVIVVPAGTAHRFNELDGVIEYLVFRFEAVD